CVPELGKFLVVLGAVIVVLGLLLWSGVGSGWLGRLPGDIRIERGNSTFYFPIVTCIIISIVLSLIFSLFRRYGDVPLRRLFFKRDSTASRLTRNTVEFWANGILP